MAALVLPGPSDGLKPWALQPCSRGSACACASTRMRTSLIEWPLPGSEAKRKARRQAKEEEARREAEEGRHILKDSSDSEPQQEQPLRSTEKSQARLRQQEAEDKAGAGQGKKRKTESPLKQRQKVSAAGTGSPVQRTAAAEGGAVSHRMDAKAIGARVAEVKAAVKAALGKNGLLPLEPSVLLDTRKGPGSQRERERERERAREVFSGPRGVGTETGEGDGHTPKSTKAHARTHGYRGSEEMENDDDGDASPAVVAKKKVAAAVAAAAKSKATVQQRQQTQQHAREEADLDTPGKKRKAPKRPAKDSSQHPDTPGGGHSTVPVEELTPPPAKKKKPPPKPAPGPQKGELVPAGKVKTPTQQGPAGKTKNKSPTAVAASVTAVARKLSADPSIEPCQLGDQVVNLPAEVLFVRNPRQIFSVDTWYTAFSDEDREYLAEFLPQLGGGDGEGLGEDPLEVLEELFDGGDMLFSSPVSDFWQRLRRGQYHPALKPLVESFQSLVRKKHYMELREYHNNMVASLEGMKGVFDSLGDRTSLAGKLKQWKKATAGGKHLPALKLKTPPAPALAAPKPYTDAAKLPPPKKKPTQVPQGRTPPPPASLAPSPTQRSFPGKAEGAEGERTGAVAKGGLKKLGGGRTSLGSSTGPLESKHSMSPHTPHTPHGSGSTPKLDGFSRSLGFSVPFLLEAVAQVRDGMCSLFCSQRPLRQHTNDLGLRVMLSPCECLLKFT